jgi:integrase
LTKTLNKYLKRIGKEMSLPFKLTTGISRHSWASVLKNNGYSDTLIGDGLGHENPKTTQNYLGSIDDNLVKEMSESLL